MGCGAGVQKKYVAGTEKSAEAPEGGQESRTEVFLSEATPTETSAGDSSITCEDCDKRTVFGRMQTINSLDEMLDFDEHPSPLSPVDSKNSRKSNKISTATSGGQYGEATQTLIFFDWDDTLFPTNAIFKDWGLDPHAETDTDLHEELALQLQQWRDALSQHLSTAATLSERCVIVTNSKRPWVQRCVRRFAPDLEPLLEEGSGSVTIVYASEASTRGLRRLSRATDDEEMNDILTKAKQAAMKQEAQRFYSKYPGQTWKNILSFGDMPYEHRAVQEVTFLRRGAARERVRTKAITEPTNPSIGQLTFRLRIAERMMPVYVRHDGDLSLELQAVKDPVQVIAEATGVTQLKEQGTPLYAWGLGPEPTQEEQASALQGITKLVQQHLYESLCAERGLDVP